MEQSDTICDNPFKLELSKRSYETLGPESRIFIKMSANTYTFCLLDIKGYLFSMGSNLNGICGFN